MPSLRNYSNTSSQATLVQAQSATDTAIVLTGMSGYPVAPFTAALARGTASEEVVLVTAVNGSTVTVIRGYDSTLAQAQGAGATFQEVVAAVDFSDANQHVNTVAGAHGTTSALVGVNDIQTLTNKTLTAPTITDPTITGTATLATANITTLNIGGTETAAGLAVTGALTVGGLATLNGGLSAASASVSGALSAGSATVSGAATVGGVLAVNGGATVPTGKRVTLTDAPTATTDAANKAYVDAVTSGATSAPTVNTLMKRDSAGRAQVVDPSASADIATKNYVDGKFSDTGWVAAAISTGWSGSLQSRVKNGILYVSGLVQRTGGTTSPFTNVSMATLAAGHGPVQNAFITASSGNSVYGEVNVTARVVAMNGVATTNQFVPVTITTPID